MTTIPITFHPLDRWPHPDTDPRRGRYTFRAGWNDTLAILDYELGLLHAERVVLQADFRARDIRLDGLPRGDARQPEHPGVILSFESRVGPQRYASDGHDLWQHNVRGIALGLEALRAVDRYGITRSGEQYAGWKQLTAGSGITTRQAAIQLLARLTNGHEPSIAPISVDNTDQAREYMRGLYRKALKAAHPDTGGTSDLLASVRDAGRLLGIVGRP